MVSADDVAIAEGLAAIATTAFEMGQSQDDAERAVLTMWDRLLRPEGALQAAAAAIAQMPQPLSETAEQTMRREPMREQLGVTSATAQLEAMLAARDLLERLHREVG